MSDLQRLILGCVLFVIGQSLVWIQINGQFKWEWFKNHDILVAMIFAFPIAYIFLKGNEIIYHALGQSFWSMKMLAFGLGMISFTILTWAIGNELPSLKNMVCVGLSILILGVQIFWK